MDINALSEDQKGQINDAIRNSIPQKAGKRNGQTFELIRRLQSISGIDKSIDPNSLRPLVKIWHDMAVKHAKENDFWIHGNFTETWNDFRYGWSRVKYPVGMCLDGVVESIKKNKGKHPKEVQHAGESLFYTDDHDMMLLLTLCHAVNEFHEGVSFFLSAREAERRLTELGSKQNRQWCGRRLKQLTEDGVLRVLEPGTPGTGGKGKSTVYAWIWENNKTEADLSWLDNPTKVELPKTTPSRFLTKRRRRRPTPKK